MTFRGDIELLCARSSAPPPPRWKKVLSRSRRTRSWLKCRTEGVRPALGSSSRKFDFHRPRAEDLELDLDCRSRAAVFGFADRARRSSPWSWARRRRKRPALRPELPRGYGAPRCRLASAPRRLPRDYVHRLDAVGGARDDDAAVRLPASPSGVRVFVRPFRGSRSTPALLDGNVPAGRVRATDARRRT